MTFDDEQQLAMVVEPSRHRAAEFACAALLDAMGVRDVQVTRQSGDGGVDVVGTGFVAQVKDQGVRVVSADLERLVGSALRHGAARTVFFARSGFAATAVEFADLVEVDMALFEFGYDASGLPFATAVSAAARALGAGLATSRSASKRDIWRVKNSIDYVGRITASAAKREEDELSMFRAGSGEFTGVRWTPVPLTHLHERGAEAAGERFLGALPVLVWNAAALEGNACTPDEVQSLVSGVGLVLSHSYDERQVIALAEGYRELGRLVSSGEFRLDRATSNRLHGLVARHEAIESGHFRGEGVARGGGTVRLANGGSVPGLEHGEGGQLLIDRFHSTVDYLATLPDPRERALAYFAAATRSQFYFDGNKRTARLMMTGELMASGYDAVNIPYARQLEFNRHLDTMFTTDDATDLMAFLATCVS